MQPTANAHKASFEKTKDYSLALAWMVTGSYAVYLFFSENTVANLGKEDHFFEWLTAICLFIASLLFFQIFLTNKNTFCLLLSLLLFVGAGEEISWGQRILGFQTPPSIKAMNVQNEFNLHNLSVFNTENFDKTRKKGWTRLLEINFLFRVFCMIYGIVLPLLALLSHPIKKMIAKYEIPLPPLSIGLFFGISWLQYYLLMTLLPPGRMEEYYYTAGEIFECTCSYVLLASSLYCFFSLQRTNSRLKEKSYI